MDEQLKQIGERLRGLRDVLDIPVSEMAETIGIAPEKYEKIEEERIFSIVSEEAIKSVSGKAADKKTPAKKAPAKKTAAKKTSAKEKTDKPATSSARRPAPKKK